MARIKIPYKTTVAVRLKHPTDVINKDPLDFSDDGATCSFKAFDAGKDESLSANEASGQTVLSVNNADKFKVADVVEVTLNSGAVHPGTIDLVDAVLGTIRITVGLPSAADAGNRVRVRLGSEVTMTEYGTARLGTIDWGFSGDLASNHPGLDIDVEVDIEISFIGAGGGGLDLLDVICAVVRPVKDCR